MTAEQEARDMLGRMGVANAHMWTTGELVELANLIAKARAFTQEDVNLLEKLNRANDYQETDRHSTPVIDTTVTVEETLRLRSLASRIKALIP